MEKKGHVNNVRLAPRKAMLVADMIRGKAINDALNDLRLSTRRRASDVFSKLIGATASAVNEEGQVDVDALFVKQVIVNQGPTMKRWKPRAQGRGFPILKKTSHITVILGDR